MCFILSLGQTPLTVPLSTVSACRGECVSGRRGARCCVGGTAVSSPETAVAVATPVPAHT